MKKYPIDDQIWYFIFSVNIYAGLTRKLTFLFHDTEKLLRYKIYIFGLWAMEKHLVLFHDYPQFVSSFISICLVQKMLYEYAMCLQNCITFTLEYKSMLNEILLFKTCLKLILIFCFVHYNYIWFKTQHHTPMLKMILPNDLPFIIFHY